MIAAERTSRRAWALAAGVILIGANLRIGIAGVPPLLSRLGLGHLGMSLLAATPVLCFGLVAPLAPGLRRILGEEQILLWAVLGLGGGLVLRAWWFPGGLFPGTILLACSVALINVLLPSLIKRRAPGSAGVLSGGYVTAMNIGATLGAGLSVPASEALGGSVRTGLGIWAIPAAIAILVWLPQVHGVIGRVPRATGHRRAPKLLTNRLAWHVTLFMGLQALNFYALLSWLPTLYSSRGVSATDAGLLLALDNLAVIPASFIVPTLAARRPDQRVFAVLSVALCLVGVGGILLAPTASAPVWVSILGLGQGGTFGLALLFMVLRASDPESSAHLSAMAQSIGYLLAALGPLGCGLLHALSHGWDVPLEALLAIAVVEVVVGIGASRPITVGAAVA